MGRKRCHRIVRPAVPPRGLRPKLPTDQVLAMHLVHVQHLDAIATGAAPPEMIYSWVAQVLTWSRASALLNLGSPEMVEQLNMAESVCQRFVRTGAVRFSGPEYQLAKTGLQVMDELTRVVDQHTALIATEWAEEQIHLVRARMRAERTQASTANAHTPLTPAAQVPA